MSPTDAGRPELEALVGRVPEGWTEARFDGRRYGIVRRSHVDGRSVTVWADELGGSDLISANVYRTAGGAVLKPCEMPADKVLGFLRGWVAARDEASDASP